MFLTTPNRNPTPIAVTPHFPFPQPPSITNSRPRSVDLLILGGSCKWNLTLGGLQWLTFTSHDVFKVCSCCSVYQRLISFHCWKYSIMRIFHNLFIHSFVDGHLSHFHLSSIMKNADINVLYKFLCEHTFSVLLGIHLGMELLSHIVTLFLTFWGTARLFSKVATPFYIPTSCMWGFWLLPHPCQHLLLSFLDLQS